jgi:hypothetical protein
MLRGMWCGEQEAQYRSSRGLKEEESGEGAGSTASAPPSPGADAAAGVPLPDSGSESSGVKEDEEEGSQSERGSPRGSSGDLAESEGSVSSRCRHCPCSSPLPTLLLLVIDCSVFFSRCTARFCCFYCLCYFWNEKCDKGQRQHILDSLFLSVLVCQAGGRCVKYVTTPDSTRP